MGNVQSATTQLDKYENNGGSTSFPHLDFDNMPFLRPPEGSADLGPNASRYEKDSQSPEDSPTVQSPLFAQSEWYQGHAKWPSYHDTIEKSPDLSMRGEFRLTSASQGSLPYKRSPSSSYSGSSITSQLSLLSQVYPASASPRLRHRERGRSLRRETLSRSTSEMSVDSPSSASASPASAVDANVPPEVPPHLVFPQSRSQDSETETALAAIEALESEVEEDVKATRRTSSGHFMHQDSARFRSRSRSRSRSRRSSVARSASSASTVNEHETPFTTDIYTRKCFVQDAPPLVQSRASDQSASSEDHSDTDTEEPISPESSPFALKGYDDGTTKLRVVNWDNPPQNPSYSLPTAVSHEKYKEPEKFRVKSKAQLAEEEEMQRRRYARYGHVFRYSGARRSV